MNYFLLEKKNQTVYLSVKNMITFESFRDWSFERKFSNVLKSFLDFRQNVAQSVLTIVDADPLKLENQNLKRI